MSVNDSNDFSIHKVRDMTELEKQYIHGGGFSFSLDSSSSRNIWVYNYTGMTCHATLTVTTEEGEEITYSGTISADSNDPWKISNFERHQGYYFRLTFEGIPLNNIDFVTPWVVKV